MFGDNKTINGYDKEWNGTQLMIGGGKAVYKLTKEMQALHDKECGLKRTKLWGPFKTPKKRKQSTLDSYLLKNQSLLSKRRSPSEKIKRGGYP